MSDARDDAAASERWQALAQALIALGDAPEHEAIGRLVGEGLAQAPEQVSPALVMICERGSWRLVYELFHAIIDAELSVDRALSEAAQRWLHDKQPLMFMAALGVVLRTRHQPPRAHWRRLRRQLSAQREALGRQVLRELEHGSD